MHLLAACIILVALGFASSLLTTTGLGGKTQVNVKLRGGTSAVHRHIPAKTFSSGTRLASITADTALINGGASPSSTAQTSVVAAGFDLYGRVPNDDWLFATRKLVGKDVLKKSHIEAAQHELPITLAHFNRRKAIHTALMIMKGVVGVFTGLVLLGWMVMVTKERIRKDKILELELRGFSTPVSASYKGAQQAGRLIEGNPDWVDLSRRNQNRVDDELRRAEEEEEEQGEAEEDQDQGQEDRGRPNATGGGGRGVGGGDGQQAGSGGGGRSFPAPNKGAGRNDDKSQGKGNKDKGAGKKRGKHDEGDPDDDYSDIND